MNYETGNFSHKYSASNLKYKSHFRYFLAGISAVTINVFAIGALAYFSPWSFGKLKGDIPFSLNNGSLNGYVRCKNKTKEVVVFEKNKFVSLEEALSHISGVPSKREKSIEEIMKEINKYNCSK